MNTAPSIKLIKNADRKDHGVQIAFELAVDPNRWSSAVRSWIVEFQQRDRSPDASGLPAFDSLFRDAAPAVESRRKIGSS